MKLWRLMSTPIVLNLLKSTGLLCLRQEYESFIFQKSVECCRVYVLLQTNPKVTTAPVPLTERIWDYCRK